TRFSLALTPRSRDAPWGVSAAAKMARRARWRIGRDGVDEPIRRPIGVTAHLRWPLKGCRRFRDAPRGRLYIGGAPAAGWICWCLCQGSRKRRRRKSALPCRKISSLVLLYKPPRRESGEA